MHKLCTNCHYLGEPKFSFWGGNLYYGIILSLIALVSLPLNGHILGSHFLYVFLAFIVLISGILQIVGYYRGVNKCPICGNEMLSLNNPEAIEIIKKHDLRPGENPPSNPETSA